VKAFLVWIICFCATIAIIYAQDTSTYGAIYGQVLSVQQHVLGDAQVKIASGPSRVGTSVKSRGLNTIKYDGGFFIPRLLPGTYTVEVSHQKYLPGTYEGLKVTAGNGIYLVAELQPKEDVAGAISGTVTVRGASVKGLVVGYIKADSKKPEKTFTLKADGRFSFSDVMPGSYFITVSKDRDEVYRSSQLKVVKKKTARHTVRIDPKKLLDKPGWITGKVTGPDRKPVSGASITMTKTPEGQRKVSTRSDSDGKYEIKNLRPGSYELKAVKSGIGIDTDKITVRSNRGSRKNFYLKEK
jgi:hypothetical protein